ncbi:uncharacterized protein Tco025E_06930 [Trypanosoma conorhini]|uniref:Uncharacterized protein n=1 Tax=Trypanosoma conorhini TaxID=83891 RepID=A0A3R7KU86_9TRYP|nr:uncharacterized protein Tco025E_06930 [Trypanosoma conorhini]RNF09823.1 hypothetical protein Tco025E_06930 [Trypanosoma conorhini]
MLTAAALPPSIPPVETPPLAVGSTRLTASSGYQPPLPASVPPPSPPPPVPSPTATFSTTQPPVPALATTAVAPVVKDASKGPGPIPGTATTSPSIAVLPTYIPVVPPVVRYNEETQHISAPPLPGAPTQAVVSLRERCGKEHRTRLRMQPLDNRYLWRPAPTSESIASESWRGIYWKHVDVHRYVARRYRGNPPPIE